MRFHFNPSQAISKIYTRALSGKKKDRDNIHIRMEYYALLTVATTVIVILALALYRKSGDLGTLVGTAALYYWSLFGAWYIVLDKSGGYSGKFYHYLEYKMFEVNLDSNYMAALACYAAFVILAQLALLLATPKRQPREGDVPKLLMRHGPILMIAVIAGAASIFLIEDKISTAWALNTSAYYYTRTQTDQWFTLHQVLNRVAMIPPSIGFATYLAGNRSRFFVSVARRYTLGGYVVVLAGMALFTFILGNKNEVFVSLLTGFLCYLASVRTPQLLEGRPDDCLRTLVSLRHRFLSLRPYFGDASRSHPAH